jgi:hypothetical protein
MKLFGVRKEKQELENTIHTILTNDKLSKSEKMRELFELGLEISLISELLGVRYNFVYNVITTYTRMKNIEVNQPNDKEDIRYKIVHLFMRGYSNVDISKELRISYDLITQTLVAHQKEMMERLGN